MQVYKYELPINDMVVMRLHEGTEILYVAEQGQGHLFMWALVDPHQPQLTRRFIVRGTGHVIAYERRDLRYIGIAPMYSGGLVFHVFEELSDSNAEADEKPKALLGLKTE